MTADPELVKLLQPIPAERGVDMLAEPPFTERLDELEMSPFHANGNGAAPEAVAAASLRIVSLESFASAEEDSAEPLLGTADDMILAAGGLLILYGDGGTAKTTLTLDAAFHMAAGIPWLGIEVAAE
jgi:hypothetical protein